MTTVLPYEPAIKQDGSCEITFQSITANSDYEHKSFEELRFDHYLASGKMATPTKKIMFGGALTPQNGDGAPTSSAFGSTPSKPATGSFGSSSSNSSSPTSDWLKVPQTGATSLGGRATKKRPSGGTTSSAPAPAFGSGNLIFGATPVEVGGGFPFESFGGGRKSSSDKKATSVSASAFSFGTPSTPSSVQASTTATNDKLVKAKKKISRASLKSETISDSLEGYEHYRSFMDKLAESGVDDYVDLPMIAVMGDTSSGKSSLLSNISLVELPSSDTLTTRCPIRLQMRNAKTRTASVKVVWKDKPFGVGVDFEEQTVGEENWNSITDIIAEAQAHIIEKSGKEVARDIVCVDMQGPHCENLTLIDLPGIVRSTGKGESSTLADDINALMHDYLDNERCVILAVHPANVDFHNSQILAEAKEVDPETKRTIPVLTKPDLIDDGAETSVVDLLKGKLTDKFEMGFHMIKGRGQKDLNEDVGIEDGLTKEEAFFRNKEPWRSVDQSKFGTKSLRVKLAGLQMKLIQESFDSIISEMKDRRDEAALELKSLGDIPLTLREKRALFRKVREEIRKGLSSESLNGRISQLHSNNDKRPSAEFHLASKEFQKELNSSKLANISSIQVGTKVIVTINGKQVQDTVCFIDEKDGFVYVEKKVIKNKDHDLWKGFKKPGLAFEDKGRVYFARMDGTFDKLKQIDQKLVRVDPQWIGELIEQNRPYNLPIFPNPDVFDAIVADQIKEEWTAPTGKLLNSTVSLMQTTSDKFIDSMQMIKSLPSLAKYLIRKSCDVVETIKQDTESEIKKFIEREQTPFTQNHYLFENLSKLRTQRLMDEVLASVSLHCNLQEKAPTESLTDNLSSAIQNIFEMNQKRSIDDHMAEEMQNALDSYGKVAYKRFVDSVPMICIQIMQRFPKMLNDILEDVMDNEIEDLVTAPPGAVASMNALKKEVETLEKGIDTVKGLSRGGINLVM